MTRSCLMHFKMGSTGVRIILVRVTETERWLYRGLFIGLTLLFTLQFAVPFVIYSEITAWKDTLPNPKNPTGISGNDSDLVFVLADQKYRNDELACLVSMIGFAMFIIAVAKILWSKMKTMYVLSQIGISPLKHGLFGNLETEEIIEGLLLKARMRRMSNPQPLGTMAHP